MQISIKKIISSAVGAGVLVFAFQNCAPGFDSEFDMTNQANSPPQSDSSYGGGGTPYQPNPPDSNDSGWPTTPPAYTDGQELANEQNGGQRRTTDSSLRAIANPIDTSHNAVLTDFLGNKIFPIYLYSSDSYGDIAATSPSCNGWHRYYISAQKNGPALQPNCDVSSGPMGQLLRWKGETVNANTRALQANLRNACVLKTNTLYYVHVIKVSNFTSGCRSRFHNSSDVKNDLIGSAWKEAQ